jgi:hypothetical protein
MLPLQTAAPFHCHLLCCAALCCAVLLPQQQSCCVCVCAWRRQAQCSKSPLFAMFLLWLATSLAWQLQERNMSEPVGQVVLCCAICYAMLYFAMPCYAALFMADA